MKKMGIYVLIISLIIISSCQLDQTQDGLIRDTTNPEILVFETDLADGVEELGTEKDFIYDDLSAANTTVTIVGEPSETEKYNIGTVLYLTGTEAADGKAVKKITGVTPTADGVVLTTENALITEAFDELNIHVKTQLGANDDYEVQTVSGVKFIGMYTSSELSRRGFQTIDDSNYDIDGVENFFGFKIDDYVLYDDDGNTATTDDQIVIDGLLYLSLYGEYDLVTNRLNIEEFGFQLTGKQYLELGNSYDLNLIDIDDEMPLGYIDFPIGTTGLILNVDFFLGLDASVDATLSTGFKEQATVNLGIGYYDSEWDASYENLYSFQLTPFLFSGTCTFRPYIGIAIGVSFLNCAGVSLNTELYTQVTANCDAGIVIDNFSDSFLDDLIFDGHVNIILGVNIDAITYFELMGFTVAEFDYPIANLYATMLDAPRL